MRGGSIVIEWRIGERGLSFRTRELKKKLGERRVALEVIWRFRSRFTYLRSSSHTAYISKLHLKEQKYSFEYYAVRFSKSDNFEYFCLYNCLGNILMH